MKTFLRNLRRLWFYSLAEDYKAQYARWEDCLKSEIATGNRLNALIADYKSSGHQNVISDRLADLQSNIARLQLLLGALVKDVEDLKNERDRRA